MRLIDEAKVINEIERFKGYLDDDMIMRIKIAINRLPTIEAVEVVRCKDCKYSEYKQGELRCYIWSISSKTKEDGYCFCGASMDEEEL